MADTGWVFPGTAVADRPISGSSWDWINQDNIKADDGNNAEDSGSPTGDSSGLAASNFDFSSIPAGSIIDGIEVQVGDYRKQGGTWGWAVVRLILADDSDGTENKNADLAAPTESDQTDQVGGASELWSETIGLSDVQDVDWGFFIGADRISGPGVESFFVDFMQMKVYYHLADTYPLTGVEATSAVGDIIMQDSNLRYIRRPTGIFRG